MSTPAESEIQSALEAYPAYKDGSAYERTKICCEVLARLGERIPSWLVIRGHIKKGSATDINRGIKDFREEQGVRLQRLHQRPEGLPDALTQPMQALWHAALTEARSDFEEQREALLAEQMESDRALAVAMGELDTKAAALEHAEQRVAELQSELGRERERGNTERAAREQAERMAAQNIADLGQQRREMSQVIAANTQELHTLTTRLDEERRRAMREIDTARQQVALARQEGLQEGEQKAAKLETTLRREVADARMEHAQAMRRFNELAEANTSLRADHAQAMQRNAELAEANAALRALLSKEKHHPLAAPRKPAGKALPGRARKLKRPRPLAP